MNTPRSRFSSLLPLAPSVAVGLALYFLVTIPAVREARRGFETRAYSVANVLTLALEAAITFEDQKAVEEYLDAAAHEPWLKYAVARKPDGKVLGGTETAPLFPELLTVGTRTLEASGLWHLAVPVKEGGRPAGWLQLGFDLSELSNNLMATRIAGGLVSLIGAVLTGLLFSRSTATRRRMLQQIAATSVRLRSTSVQMVSASSQQAAAASEHAAAVEQTRRTMQALVSAATRISAASREVLGHADLSTSGAQAVSQAIRTLASQAEKIGDISELIRSIADKSDLLALNASLEGTKAGEAGRGFSLVANEMRRLSESVLGAAREIKTLAGAIHGASETAESSVMGLRTASERTSNAVREISQITEQQREATEQVTRSMDELSSILTETGSSIRRTEESASQLLNLADSLAQLTAQVVKRPRPGASQPPDAAAEASPEGGA